MRSLPAMFRPGSGLVIPVLMFLLAGLMLGSLAMPRPAAAFSGTTCGSLTAFSAPTLASDGSMTFDGETQAVQSGSVDTATAALLTALATADADTCLTAETDADNDITSLDVAATARICGQTSVDGDGNATVNGVVISDEVLGDADDAAQLAAASDAELCVTVRTAPTSVGGLLAGELASVSADATICATVDAVDGNQVTVDGVSFPISNSSNLEAGDQIGLRLTASTDEGLTAVVADVAGCEATGGQYAGNINDGTGDATDATNSPADKLPDTAMAAPTSSPVPLMLLGLAALLGGAYLFSRRIHSQPDEPTPGTETPRATPPDPFASDMRPAI